MKHPLTRTGKELLDADSKHIADCDTEEIAEEIIKDYQEFTDLKKTFQLMSKSRKRWRDAAHNVTQ